MFSRYNYTLGQILQCQRMLKSQCNISINHKLHFTTKSLTSGIISKIKQLIFRSDELFCKVKWSRSIFDSKNNFSTIESPPYKPSSPIREPNMPEKREKKDDKKERKEKKPVIRTNGKSVDAETTLGNKENAARGDKMTDGKKIQNETTVKEKSDLVEKPVERKINFRKLTKEEQMKIYEMKNYSYIKPIDLIKDSAISQIKEKRSRLSDVKRV